MFGADNQQFLNSVSAVVKAKILDSIATHYGIAQEAALEEVTSNDAYWLLEYMVEPQRSATLVFWEQHGFPIPRPN